MEFGAERALVASQSSRKCVSTKGFDHGEREVMAYMAPEEWKRLRYRSEEEWRAAVEARAREIWDRVEQAMWGDDAKWKKYRQSWEEGTDLARDKCIIRAERELGQ